MRTGMTRGWAALIRMLEAISTWGLKDIGHVFMTIVEVRPYGEDGARGGGGGVKNPAMML